MSNKFAWIMSPNKDWEDKKLTPEIKSLPIPTEQKGPVYVLVAKNFKEECVKADVDCLVKFYGKFFIIY